jgi:hypothetical protein
LVARSALSYATGERIWGDGPLPGYSIVILICSTALSPSDCHATGKRIPGLKLDNPRQLALMRFSHIAAANSFTTAELYPRVLDALGSGADRYTLASLRYDLSKLRAKGLVERLPHSRRYRLLPNGYSICLVFLKLFERVSPR